MGWGCSGSVIIVIGIPTLILGILMSNIYIAIVGIFLLLVGGLFLWIGNKKQKKQKKKRYEEYQKWLNSTLDKNMITFSSIERIYKSFATDYVTKEFKRDYLSIHTKQGDYTSKYKTAVGDLQRYFRRTLFNDDDSVKEETYNRLSNCKTNGEFNNYVRDYLKELLDNRGNNTTGKGYWEYIGNETDRQRTVSNAQRQQILRRDNFTCQLCGARGPGARPNPGNAVLKVDHKLPFSKGGTDDDSNLWTLCEECNYGKGNKYDDRKM